MKKQPPPKRDREVIALEKVVEAFRILGEMPAGQWSQRDSGFSRDTSGDEAIKRVLRYAAERVGLKLEVQVTRERDFATASTQVVEVRNG